MRIEHLAIWTKDIDKMKAFYLRFFDVSSNKKYVNSLKGFSSYFLSFKEGARIELMHLSDISDTAIELHSKIGLAHFALSVGSKEKVDSLTNEIRQGGFKVVGEPRITGDGYYESVISDPEGNLIELTI